MSQIVKNLAQREKDRAPLCELHWPHDDLFFLNSEKEMCLMMPNVLTAEELALLPTDEEVQCYQTHGYYQSKKIFTDREIDARHRRKRTVLSLRARSLPPHFRAWLAA